MKIYTQSIIHTELNRVYTQSSIHHTNIAMQGSVLFSIVIVVALNMAIGLLPHVDNFAHIGGFITGILLGFILLPRPGYSWRQYQNYNQQGTPFKSEFKIYQLLLLAFSLILLVIW